MKFNATHAEWAALVLWVALVGIVFWQTNTDFVRQGIASGGPFHNAAMFPEIVAVVIALCAVPIGVQAALRNRKDAKPAPALSLYDLRRPLALLLAFSLYLALLDVLGYYIATVPFLFFIIWLCGERKILNPAIFSVVVTFVVALVFQRYLTVVLPRGYLADYLGF